MNALAADGTDDAMADGDVVRGLALVLEPVEAKLHRQPVEDVVVAVVETHHVAGRDPHTAAMVTAENWAHDYPRELAAFPLPSLKKQKYWPPVARVDKVERRVESAFARIYCTPVALAAGAAHVLTFDPSVEQAISSAIAII